jgi:integrase
MIGSTPVTFATQANAYLAWLETRNNPAKPTSVATVKSLLSNHAIPIIGQQPLVDFDNDTMRTLVAELVQRKKLSPSSILHVQKFVKRVLANATDSRGNQLYPRAWNRQFIDPPKAIAKKQPKVSREQIEACLQTAPTILRELLATLAATGIRRGEALALNVSDFDSQLGLLHINRTRSCFGETTPKTEDSVRKVDLHPDIVAMLKRLIGERKSGRLFGLEVHELHRGFVKMSIKPHSLRRYRVTWLRKQRCDEDILRFWIGHGKQSKTQTDEYSFLCEDVDLRQRLVREVGLGFTLPAFDNAAMQAQVGA